MSPQSQAFSASVFENAVLVSVTIRRPGNTKKLDTGKGEHGAWLAQSKKLLDAKSFKEINKGFNAAMDAIKRYKIPCSIIKDGIYLVAVNSVQSLNDDLVKAHEVVQVEARKFAFEDYFKAKQEAEVKLSHLQIAPDVFVNAWNDADYISESEMFGKFGIEWTYLSIGIPQNIPAAVAETAQSNLNGKIEDTFPAIREGLRNEFMSYVSHAIEKLEDYGPDTVDGKRGKKLYKVSVLDEVLGFADTFEARNLTQDSELDALVQDGKRAASRFTIEYLRENQSARTTLSREYRAILNTMETWGIEAEAEQDEQETTE